MIRSQLRAARATDRKAPPPKQRKETTSRPSTEYRGGQWGYDLTERLRLLKGDLGARAWADFLGLSNSLISSYLSGGRQPSAPSLRIIAEKTGVSLDWLLFGEGGTGPVYRGQSRPQPELEADLAAHLWRTQGAYADPDGAIDERQALMAAELAVRRDVERWNEWALDLLAFVGHEAAGHWKTLESAGSLDDLTTHRDLLERLLKDCCSNIALFLSPRSAHNGYGFPSGTVYRMRIAHLYYGQGAPAVTVALGAEPDERDRAIVRALLAHLDRLTSRRVWPVGGAPFPGGGMMLGALKMMGLEDLKQLEALKAEHAPGVDPDLLPSAR